MTIDTDLLSIRRQRRQQKRCLACGVPTPRAALCATCRTTLRYCPQCEAVYPASAASQRSAAHGRSTAYCVPCAAAVRRVAGRTLDTYLAEQRARVHPQLPQIVRLHKAGRSYTQIADALGINRGTLRSIIAHAQQTGRWPTRRTRRQRGSHA